MKKQLLCSVLTLLLGVPFLYGQTPNGPLYEAFEVDSTAQPVGGINAFYRHIAHQLRVPFAARMAGAKGRVTVAGVVNPDRTLSDLSILRGLRPDCDAEALRVVNLFQNWQPAQKAGQPVRQKIMVLVEYRPAPLPVMVEGKRMAFYRADGTETANASEATVVLRHAVDSLGTPTARDEAEFLNAQGKRLSKARWTRQTVVNGQRGVDFPNLNGFGPVDAPGTPPGPKYFFDAFQTPDGRFIGPATYTDVATGQRYAEAFLTGGAQPASTVFYFPNGLKRRTSPGPEYPGEVREWYENGQLRSESVRESTDSVDAFKRPHFQTRLFNYWSEAGQPLVQDGRGTRPGYDKIGRLREEIEYLDGLPQRIVGYDSTGRPSYTERWEAGKFREGTRYERGQAVVYTVAEKSPEFKGGQAGLAQFLMKTLKYPPNAAREGVQGKVFVSFVVDEQGQVTDIEVLRSVHPDLDQEARRVVQASSGMWKPALVRGQSVKSRFNLPLTFAM
jgi:TonB family protein